MYDLKRFSFSSVEDVYDFLDKLSIIYEQKDNNEEMFCYYIDFLRMVKKVKNNKYIMAYHSLKTGSNDLRGDGSKDIDEICAEALEKTVAEYQEGLLKNVEGVVESNKEEWLAYINKEYKNKVIVFAPEISDESANPVFSTVGKEDKENLVEKPLLESECHLKEKDLQGLEDYLGTLNDLIGELEKEEKQGTKEYRKLIKAKIEVQKDINIIRRSHGEVLGNQNSMGRRSFISYDSDEPSYNHIVSTHEEYLNNVPEDQVSERNKEEKIKEIKNIAKNTLTNRQYIIFEFYYFNGLTQQEIADIMGVSQQMVAKDLPVIIRKIKREM